MGLFSKKKKVLSPVETAAKIAKDRGDYTSYFMLTYKEELSAWENLIVTSRSKMNMPLSIDQRIGALRESKSLLDGFHKWCSEREYGEEYYQFAYNQSDRSLYQRITRELEMYQKLSDHIIPEILECNGALQSELTKKLSLQYDVEENFIRNEIYLLDKKGSIRREKSGRSYLIYKA